MIIINYKSIDLKKILSSSGRLFDTKTSLYYTNFELKERITEIQIM